MAQFFEESLWEEWKEWAHRMFVAESRRDPKTYPRSAIYDDNGRVLRDMKDGDVAMIKGVPYRVLDNQ